MKRIYILGVNGNARDVLDSVTSIRLTDSKFPELGGFLDDNIERGTLIDGIPVVGKIEEAKNIPDGRFVLAIGSAESYTKKPEIIKKTGLPREAFTTVIHPSVAIASSARIGVGGAILSHSSIGANTTIGDFVMILQGSIVSHDSVVEDYSTITTGVAISGLVKIRKNAYLGSNSSIRARLEVGERALVGMGAVVVKNIPPDEVWFGNPAEWYQTRESPR